MQYFDSRQSSGFGDGRYLEIFRFFIESCLLVSMFISNSGSCSSNYFSIQSNFNVYTLKVVIHWFTRNFICIFTLEFVYLYLPNTALRTQEIRCSMIVLCFLEVW